MALQGSSARHSNAFPRNVSNWLIDPEYCDIDYGYLISRQSSAARKLLTDWDLKIEPPKSSVVWDTEESLRHLLVFERQLSDEHRSSLDGNGEEVASFRYFARMLSPHWAHAAAAPVAEPDQSAPDKRKFRADSRG